MTPQTRSGYNTLTDTWTPITNIPRVVAETRALNVDGNVWVMGGGRDAPNPNNEVDIYDPRCTPGQTGAPFVTTRRNFPTDTNGGSRVWLAGGYAPAAPDSTMEIYGAPAVTSAVSRKIHGGTPFDVRCHLMVLPESNVELAQRIRWLLRSQPVSRSPPQL